MANAIQVPSVEYLRIVRAFFDPLLRRVKVVAARRFSTCLESARDAGSANCMQGVAHHSVVLTARSLTGAEVQHFRIDQVDTTTIFRCSEVGEDMSTLYEKDGFPQPHYQIGATLRLGAPKPLLLVLLLILQMSLDEYGVVSNNCQLWGLKLQQSLRPTRNENANTVRDRGWQQVLDALPFSNSVEVSKAYVMIYHDILLSASSQQDSARYRAYKQALKNHCVPCQECLARHNSDCLNYDLERGFETLQSARFMLREIEWSDVVRASSSLLYASHLTGYMGKAMQLSSGAVLLYGGVKCFAYIRSVFYGPTDEEWV